MEKDIERVKTENFDPLAYIENAFLDTEGEPILPEKVDLKLPLLNDYLQPIREEAVTSETKKRFRKTVMSAPRPRRAKKQKTKVSLDPEIQTIWEAMPKNIEFLCSFYDDTITANYYRGEFKESRQDLIRRLLDPELSLEETSRLLGVCPATVRRYTNRKWLQHHRTQGGQRRFRLSNIAKFVEEHGRFPED